jgi:molybdate transport system permease protein
VAIDLFPLGLSLRVAGAATGLAFLVGVPLAWLLARSRFPGRDLLAILIVLPMVLPPTVLGYYLLVGLGRQSPLGRAIEAAFGEGLVFTPQGAVVAAFVAALPFLVRAAQGGFEQLDTTYEEVARTLGRTEWAIFLTVNVPLAWRSILAGLALCFARAVGEFGTTLMVAGNIPGRTQTASIAIYDAVQGGRLDQANATALLLSAATGLVLLVLARLGRAGGW